MSSPRQSKRALLTRDGDAYADVETQLPMLPAGEIERLTALYPKAAEVFVEAFRSEQLHRHLVDRRGQWMLLAISVGALVASVLGAWVTGSAWALSGLFAVGIGAIGTIIRK